MVRALAILLFGATTLKEELTSDDKFSPDSALDLLAGKGIFDDTAKATSFIRPCDTSHKQETAGEGLETAPV